MESIGAHRAHIALAELGIQYKQQIIDLSVPRTPEYLEINPRGLVPSLSYNGEILTESVVVAQFLVDLYPSHLLPPSNSHHGALTRARTRFFVDTYFDKVNSNFFKTLGATSDEALEAGGIEFINAVVTELEPLLSNTAPFYGGSNKLTFAEVRWMK
jgi:glutathione S-transferase